MAGPAFRSAWRDPLPVGNIDICPTLVDVLGLDAGTPTDGRILTESVRSSASTSLPAWRTTDVTESFDARGRSWTQRVWFDEIGGSRYLAGGAVEPA
jgi:hypothetical protein